MSWPTAAMALKAAQGALSDVTYVALFSTVPYGATPGTELAGTGYARQPVTWTLTGDQYTSGALVFTIAAGRTIRGFGLYEGTVFVGGGPLQQRTYAAGGTFTLTVTAGGI